MSRVLAQLTRWVVVVVFAAPLAWMVISSFRPQTDIFAHLNPLTLESVVPKVLTLQSYASLVSDGLLWGIANSIVAAVIAVIVGLSVCVPAAFAFAVLTFRGRGVAFALTVVCFIIPFDVLTFPLSQMVVGMGLSNTFAAIVLPTICNGFAIFLLRQFFMAVPFALCEAARVNGSSNLRILLSIYLPMSKPALIAAGIILFVAQWQSYLWPLIVAPKQAVQVATIRLGMMSQNLFDPQFGQILAYSCLLFTLPAVVMIVFQRYFIRGIGTSGLHG